MRILAYNVKLSIWAFCVFVLFQTSLSQLTYAEDRKPEDVVAKHLDSIGTAEARAAVKSRVVQGKLTFKLMVGGGGGSFAGTWGRVSEGSKSNFVMKFGGGNYRGEQFVYDENKVYVAADTSTLRRSRFGEFVHSQDYLVKEGVLGGEFSTGWALQALDRNHPRLVYAGLKKVDGRQVIDLEYHSKKGSDTKIDIYLDPETYHHVKTTYAMSISAGMGTTITNSVKQQDIRYTIEERFADFKAQDGITLPTTYSIEYTEELQNGNTEIYHWDMTADKINENIGLDPKNFDTK
ncbi:MAG TPA: hypothetical protein VH079_18680 [Terriglobales bacterium]|jgi:hypothetical protein|nr:hypothetical protein [Terriglobales bacterium]